MIAEVSLPTREKLQRQVRLRVLLYRIAFYTGLRRVELKSLQVHHISLNGAAPSINLPGEFTKNKRQASLPLRPELAADLNDWIRAEGLSASDKVFPVGKDLVKHLKRDLRAAGIPIFDSQGRVFDFHAFRKCTATYMNRQGVPITPPKEMLRHSTVELTAGVYNDGDCTTFAGPSRSFRLSDPWQVGGVAAIVRCPISDERSAGRVPRLELLNLGGIDAEDVPELDSLQLVGRDQAIDGSGMDVQKVGGFILGQELLGHRTCLAIVRRIGLLQKLDESGSSQLTTLYFEKSSLPTSVTVWQQILG